MQVKRLTLAAGVETAFEFDSFFSRSVIVKNMTGGAIQFCDGAFDATKSAIIPAFGWQTFTVTIPYDAAPKFYVKATVAGDVEIDFGSSMVGGTFGAAGMQLSGSKLIEAATLNVTLAGTRQQLPDKPCREITIIAKRTNTGYIYVGKNNVSATVYGAELGELDSITLPVSNTNEIYIDASVSGEGISYVAV